MQPKYASEKLLKRLERISAGICKFLSSNAHEEFLSFYLGLSEPLGNGLAHITKLNICMTIIWFENWGSSSSWLG